MHQYSSSSNVTYEPAVPNSNQTLVNYDIVIDTGTDNPTAPDTQNSKFDGGPITEDHEPEVIEIMIDNDDKKDDDTLV